MVTAKRARQRGGIDSLKSGALRVRVYTGLDPVTKRRRYISEVIPPGPNAGRLAEKARTRLLNQVDEQRNPRTGATVNHMLDKHFELFRGEPTTLETYRAYADNHIRRLIGNVKVGALDGTVFDSFYAELRRCREHCSGRKPAGHECRPLSASTIRQIHYILSGALKRAVRWRWISVSPIDQAEPPTPARPDPRPPSAADAARLLNEAWKDPDWGSFVWLAMTTGARRGELCGLRWREVDLAQGVLTYRTSIAQQGGKTWEKDTKTHQQRRVALDAQTLEVLAEHRERCDTRAAMLEMAIDRDGFVFSLAPDSSGYIKPGTVTQRYDRMAARLGIETHLHSLRHYSATELIRAGVDVRTVAGRLGHAGGGATTLRVYTAWVAESDQRAAVGIGDRMPGRPAPPLTATERAKEDPQSPYEKIAAELRASILAGDLGNGDELPTVKQLAQTHGVAAGTAHRAITLLDVWGLIDVTRGRRAKVRRLS